MGSLLAAREGGAEGSRGESNSPREPAWPHRHLLDTDVLTWPQVELVLDTADVMAEIVARRRPRSEALRGVGLTNLFYEASTRTRVEIAVTVPASPSVKTAATGDGLPSMTSVILAIF